MCDELDSNSSVLGPPNYSPPSPLPSYSIDLGSGEQRLESTPRAGSSSRRAISNFTRQSGKATLTFSEQEEGCRMPSYGRGDVISGSIVLEVPENVTELVAVVEGKLQTTYSEAGGGTLKMFKDSYTLWSRSPSSQITFPGSVSFAFILPRTFKHGGEDTALPPSYHAHYMDAPSLLASASYQVQFVIARTRHSKLEMWPKKKHITIPFRYYPRTRAPRPILPSPCFFSSVKTSPEEWFQAVTDLKTRPNVTMDPVQCHLFIPAGRVYGVMDAIPFHIQLSGSICVLRDLLSGTRLDRVTSSDTTGTTESSKHPTAKPLLKVTLARRVTVLVKGTKCWRNSTLGEGTITPVPPDDFCDDEIECRGGHIDWEGEVRLWDQKAVGAFNVAHVQVQDFLILSLSPPRDRQSPLLDLNMSVPIRLVTDSCSDIGLDSTL